MIKTIYITCLLFFCMLFTSCERASLTVVNGTGSGSYASNAKVKIKAYLPKPGYEFERWIGDVNTVEDISSKETIIVIPELQKKEVISLNIEATYEIDASAREYELKIEEGSGSGHYLTYSIITILANNPEPGFEFDKWTGDVHYLNNPYLKEQKVIIGKEDVLLKATYKKIIIPTPVPTIEPTLPPIGDIPSVNGHNATFLFNDGDTRMMNILSPMISRKEFENYVNQMKNAGANFCYLYLINQGDGPWTPYSFYSNNQIGQTVDQGIVNEYKARLQYIRSQNMGIIIWLRADDSWGFNSTAVSLQENYQRDSVNFFDEYISGYVVALESDEYMDASSVNHYAGQLKQITQKEIGVHQSPGNINHCQLSNIDSCYYQYGFEKSPSYIESDTRDKVARLGNKPLYAAEYHQTSESSEAKALGDAAIRGGAKGTGNNRNINLIPSEPEMPGYNSFISKDWDGSMVSIDDVWQRKFIFPGLGPDYGKSILVVFNDGLDLYVPDTSRMCMKPWENAQKFQPGGQYSHNNPDIPTMEVYANKGSNATKATIYYNK